MRGQPVVGLHIIAAVVAMLAGTAGGLAGAQDIEETFYRQRVLEAWTAAQADAHARADSLFDEVIADERFDELPEEERRRLLSAAAWSAARNARLPAAAAWYARVAELGSDDPDDWYRMSLVALDQQDRDAAARAMTVLIGRWPELLPNLGPDLLYPLAQVGDTSTPDRVAFQQALFDANWKGGSAGTPSGVWFQLARNRLTQGDVERARIVARRITDPETLIAMRADRRFDTLLDPSSWRANVAHASSREIERMRLLVEAYPEHLEPIVSLGHQLLLGGHHAEAIALSDATLARIASAPLDTPPFTDLERQVWLMNHKSLALRRTGHIEEAVAELQRASRLGEDGVPNISQTLNLGTLECDRGRPESALAAAATAGEEGMSPYGRAVRAAIRHCAALQLDDAAGAAAALDELSGLVDDAPIRYLEALVWDGQPDRAATLMRDLLLSEEQRSQALEWAQDCRLPEPLPIQVQERALKQAFLARPDVLSAINAVGRIDSYDLYCHING
jgi:tetratricopeptide (TPR) repeat protein